MMAEMGKGWQLKIFSDVPPPTARDALQLHGSGQANVVPEPHSQYTAHNSFALGFKYRLAPRLFLTRGTTTCRVASCACI
eukprot:Skav202289  [mRNA]  locus=scaffold3364:45557:48546:+ [translate_table: standard]